MINSVNIAGNLTRDMEIRTAKTGLQIGTVGIAVNDRRKNKNTGEWEDDPSFFDLKMFGTRAEKLAPYLTKGTKVSIQGKLIQERWEKDGKTVGRVFVYIDEIEFLSSKGGKAAEGTPAGAEAHPLAEPEQQPEPIPVFAQIIEDEPVEPMGGASFYDGNITDIDYRELAL